MHLALAFPDLYDLGLGNLGLLILYAILNELPWCWAERAYAPARDMEAALRERKLPLFSHESKTPLAELDAIGFTLQSELTYTNILNMLDLAQVPLRAEQRGDAAPLVFAGGPCVFNPEPLAPFMDFFVIGDGEEAVVEVAQALRETADKPRAAKLEALARIDGVYAPALYPVETLSDGRVVPAAHAPQIRRRLVRDLDAAKFPTKLVVPFTQQVHDRAGIEVLRGCTHGCRFCQAGMTTRPVRERSLETIDTLLEKIISETGYEEASL
ncbi:MAG TPA: B12-binding domain-containing radical SAM protein, partial [Candidatus Hydrogenedentes bacterium]|nr:B12-binding domain-containing radical SAM protein [Candidatus Hydrogenedentota bacterium]